jgi:site-specific DNA-methyltransferase (adenine-specific)
MSKNEMKFIKGRMEEKIIDLKNNSIDLIYTDPPFAITSACWDKKIDWSYMFPQMWRVLKPTGKIILYASMPFTYELIKHEKPKYHYTWIKNNSTGFLSTKYQPLRNNEEIFVYYKKTGTYNPQMVGTEHHDKRNVKFGGKNGYWGEENSKKKNSYNSAEGHVGRFPTTVQFWNIRKGKCGITRDDKQIDYFIKTYSNENDIILDLSHHNSIVGDRCNLLKRNYIGIDPNPMLTLSA